MSASTFTKKELGQALKELMKTKPLSKITVAMICEQCDLNRQTFYYHFQDIYECLGTIYKTEVIEKLPEFESLDQWPPRFLNILKYIEENKVFCLNTFNSLGRDHLEMFLTEVSFSMINTGIQQIANDVDIDSEQLKFIINFYAIAFTGLVIQWLTHGCRENSEQLAMTLAKMLQGNFSTAINNLKNH